MTVKSHKKLIEVALPLDAINKAAKEEKAVPRHGHPQTLHYWWARRPLAAARAIIFAQMVDDPSSNPDLFPTEKKQEKERERLFKILEELVQWENTTNEKVLQAARDEIWQSWRRACAENAGHPQAKEIFNRKNLPAFHDPFAGGGTLPLEAQRLGLESFASDLNPVAVLINKAMIEIPPKFAAKPPVNPDWRKNSKQEQALTEWKGARGLAADVRYYGQWMRDEAEKRIRHLYPKIEITPEMTKGRPDLKKLVGEKLTVIACLWARTVKSPNPAFRDVDVPLASTFMLSCKNGKEVYVEPIIAKNGYQFTVKLGKPTNMEAVSNGTKVGRGGHFQCLMSGSPIPVTYIRQQGLDRMLGSRLMAIVAESDNGRVYIEPNEEQEAIAAKAKPSWSPDLAINYNPRDIRSQLYGLTKYSDLFTARQLVALTTFSDLIEEARELVRRDCIGAGMLKDRTLLHEGGHGASAYADAVSVYLGCALSRLASYNNTISFWNMKGGSVAFIFARQAIPMSWDYIEVNPLEKMSGNWTGGIEWVSDVLDQFTLHPPPGYALQADASIQQVSKSKVISTDPPYYDNIGYADLSDFFYVWLRPCFKSVFPDLFATVAVPKSEELVASSYRHGSKENAESFFLNGMKNAIRKLAELAHPAFPITIYYAFKQSETETDGGTASTGWETFLDAILCSGLTLSGTWPIRTERDSGVKTGTNVLASSILLVCHKRATNAPTATRREFVVELKRELPSALRHLQAGNIAPVDLAQASIGPGMGVFSRYEKVLDATGNPMTVREALTVINQVLDEALTEQEGDFDADSRWALAWFEQFGFAEGEYGVAETLTKAKNTSVQGLDDAGILKQGHGKVRLLKPNELPEDWDPDTDDRLTNWETVHHLIRVLGSGGESAASELVAKLGTKAEPARELAYRLYALCERKKRANDALAYNGLVQSWPELLRMAQSGPKPAAAKSAQSDLI